MCGFKYDWEEIEKEAGESLENIYKRLQSTRKMGKYLAPFTPFKISISYDAVGNILKKRGVEMLKGGFNNKGITKPKSGKKCIDCGKDRGINRLRCNICLGKISDQVCDYFV